MRGSGRDIGRTERPHLAGYFSRVQHCRLAYKSCLRNSQIHPQSNGVDRSNDFVELTVLVKLAGTAPPYILAFPSPRDAALVV